MAVRNILVEGVSGTGKSSVARELRRRGYAVVDGDRELAYRGDPRTGTPLEGDASWTAERVHAHHLWPVDRVRALAADRADAVAFFCGGSRNFPEFLDVFDAVVVLDLDRTALEGRLDARTPEEFGGTPDARELILRLHRTREDLPRDGIRIDAGAPLGAVVDEILRRTGVTAPPGGPA